MSLDASAEMSSDPKPSTARHKKKVKMMNAGCTPAHPPPPPPLKKTINSKTRSFLTECLEGKCCHRPDNEHPSEEKILQDVTIFRTDSESSGPEFVVADILITYGRKKKKCWAPVVPVWNMSSNECSVLLNSLPDDVIKTLNQNRCVILSEIPWLPESPPHTPKKSSRNHCYSYPWRISRKSQ